MPFTRDEMRDLERKLARKSYGEISDFLKPWSCDDLFDLLDSSSIKLGDSACGILEVRNKPELKQRLVEAILHNNLRTRLGRLRASNMLLGYGKRAANAPAAYLHLLRDRSRDVVDNGLFGLVFWQSKEFLPKIRAARDELPGDSPQRRSFDLAIAALQNADPFFFSPHFADPENIWLLKDTPHRD